MDKKIQKEEILQKENKEYVSSYYESNNKMVNSQTVNIL